MNASLGGIMCDSGGASEPLFVLAAVALDVKVDAHVMVKL